MSESKPDMEADISAAADGGEPVALMEPMVIAEGSRHRGALTDLAVEVAARSAGFRRSLPSGVRTALAELVLAMNCYYSNLIEGHDTDPIDIERALNNDYSNDPRKRDLQLEAKAHMTVQQWIDAGGLKDRSVSLAGIKEIHHRFCTLLPDDLLWIENPDTGERLRVLPGQLRDRDVRVGQHIPVTAGAVARFLAHFENVYSRLGRTEKIVSAAAAHHRLLWIHPFLDGNGRVARLVSHATLLETLGTGGIWSVARGLARNVVEFKSHLAHCDQRRRNDLDGRGNLSEEALAAFTRLFLELCIDQVKFMEDLVQPDRLRTRILMWSEEEIRLGHLPAKSGNILEVVLYRGELSRGDAATVVGTGDRQARRIVSTLVDKGVLKSESARAPLRLAFPAALASRWMPGLFPERTE
ncbi:MAG TPA: Fic family protein [Candidatus Saccharimonadales bacterium]|nr:Fic family protein [Candidatus Saccharimonadales bacterium]